MLVRILPTDIERYLAALRSCAAGQDSATLHRLALDHEAFLRRLAKTSTLLERRFYVVVPGEPGGTRGTPSGWWPWSGQDREADHVSRERAARLLAIRCEEVTEGFAAFGITVRRLDADALLQLWTSFLRGESGAAADGRATALGLVAVTRKGAA